MEKKQDEKDIVKTDREERAAETPADEEEWLDEPDEDEEPEWLDEPEPEDEAAEEKPAPEESADEEEWLDEPDEEEESEEEWLDEPDEEEGSEEEESKQDEELSSDEETPVDEEEEALAGIVASGMKGESTLDDAEEAYAGGGADDFEDFEDEEYSGGKKGHRKLWIGLGIAAAAVVAAYLGVGGYFWNHFQPNTVINGIECDYMTVDDLKDAIQDGIHQYELQIVERGGEEETLYGADFDLHAVYDNTLEDILRNQGAFKWPASFFREASTYDPGKAVEWNEEELQTAIQDLDCFDEAKMVKPEDAKIIFSDTAEGGDYYTIQPAEYGTQINEQLVDELITDAVDNLEGSIDLEQDDCYIVPEVTEKSPAMISACV